MPIRDISEGSRVEVTSIFSMEDAIAALKHIESYQPYVQLLPRLHVYLSGNGFTFWTEGITS